MTKTTDWRSIVLAAEPGHARASQSPVEYEFNSGRRSFSGDYQRRGAYATQPTPDDAITWNGVPITWRGIPMTYGDEE